MGVLLAFLWALELVDTVTGSALEQFGVSPRDPAELPQIYTAPLLHDDWGHLIGNSAPFFLLGTVILLSSLKRWVVSTFTAVTASGATVWLLSPPDSVTIGASGLVFGWLTYLLSRGLFSRDARQILLAVAVFAVYGGILWGVLPTSAHVSWQGHLGGAAGGVLAAWLLHRTAERRRRTAPVR
nr:rhomboid family intramembrane serine protease [Propionibacterium sp.]